MPKTEVQVSLVGEDGNAFAIIGRCKKAMRDAVCPKAQIDEFCAEAMSGDYNHLLATCLDWFEVEGD